jgi:5-methylcytosine-specific restriction endonuclease McrA
MIVLESKRKKPVGLKRNNLLSYLIKKKHNFQCQLCKTLHENIHGDVEIHHIISLEYGGDDRSDNMIVLCKKHHKDVHEGLIRINALDKICINYLGKNYSLLYN